MSDASDPTDGSPLIDAADRPEILRAPNLDGLTGLRHGFFTRRGGVSAGLYGALNCGQGSDDKAERVIENRGRAMAALGLAGDEALALVHQVHSSRVWHADGRRARPDLVKADALVCDRLGLAVGVLTADCAPVLFADAAAGVCAAAHAGWRGALAGVLENTVETMADRGARPDRIQAALGPCIRQASYEVGAELRDDFLRERPASDRFFAAGERDGHYQFDLAGFILDVLGELGLAGVSDLGEDTYTDADRFYSYRRATHRDEPDYGRLLSAVAISGD